MLRQQSIYCQENNISYAPTTTLCLGKCVIVKGCCCDGVSVDNRKEEVTGEGLMAEQIFVSVSRKRKEKIIS